MRTLQQVIEEFESNIILFSNRFWKNERAYVEIDFRLASQILPSGSQVFAVIKDSELIELDSVMYEADLPTGDWKNHIGTKTDISHNFYMRNEEGNGILNKKYEKVDYHVSL